MTQQTSRSTAARRRLGLVIAALSSPAMVANAQRAASPPGVLTLRALLDSVRATYPLIQAADSRVRAAAGSRLTARAFANPILSYQVDQTPFPGASPLPPTMEREAMTMAMVPLEPLYQRGPRVARANAQLRAAESDAAAERQRVALDAASAYYRAALGEVQLATTSELVQWLDTLVAYNRARVEEGAAAEADLIRAKLERDRMSAEAAMQAAELAQSRAALGAYLPSQSPASVPHVAVDAQPFALSESLGAHVTERAEVRAARERVTASSAGVAAEHSMIVRQLGATIGTMQSAGMTSMIAGLSLPLPFFDTNRGEMQRARAERDVAAFELAAQERSALADLRGAADAARLLTERARALANPDSTGFLARADESRRIALGAYREGAIPLFQVIDAARSWADARMTYFRTVFAQQQSVLALIVAEGGDLYTTLPAPAGGRGGQ